LTKQQFDEIASFQKCKGDKKQVEEMAACLNSELMKLQVFK